MVDDAITAMRLKTLPGYKIFHQVDALRHSIFRDGITYMREDPKNIRCCTHYIMVARYLERCGDHACKIAENVHYMETGERVEIK